MYKDTIGGVACTVSYTLMDLSATTDDPPFIMHDMPIPLVDVNSGNDTVKEFPVILNLNIPYEPVGLSVMVFVPIVPAVTMGTLTTTPVAGVDAVRGYLCRTLHVNSVTLGTARSSQSDLVICNLLSLVVNPVVLMLKGDHVKDGRSVDPGAGLKSNVNVPPFDAPFESLTT